MTKSERLRVSLEEAIRHFERTPSYNLTYADAVRIYEDLIGIMDSKVHDKKVGFIRE